MTTASLEVAVPADVRDRLDGGPPFTLTLLLTTLVLLVVAFGLWLAWAEVDRIVRAPGQIRPAGKVRIVNHPEGGRVAEIFVQEGQRVAAGQPLLAFDTREAKARFAQLEAKRAAIEAEIARLEAELEGREEAPELRLEGVAAELVEAQRRLLQARLAAFEERRRSLEETVRTRERELERARAERERLAMRLELERQQLEAVRRLAEQGLYPRLKLVDMEKEFADTKGALAKARAAEAAARAALGESRARLESLRRERESRLREELERLRTEHRLLAREIDARASALDSRVLRAPVAGIVQDLAITAAGQAVAPNAPVLKIVPEGEQLLVEALVPNEDIDEIRIGMPVTLKVRAFDFLRYGSLEGRVREIAADAVRAKRGEAVYRVTIGIEEDADPERMRLHRALQSGMLVDVEFRIGTRTLLSYLLERLLRARAEAFTEA